MTGPVVVVLVGLGVEEVVEEVGVVPERVLVVGRAVEARGAGGAVGLWTGAVAAGEGVLVAPRDGLVGDVRGSLVEAAGVSTAPGGGVSGSAVVAPAALEPDSMNGKAARAVRPPTQSSMRLGSGVNEVRRREPRPWCRSTSRT